MERLHSRPNGGSKNLSVIFFLLLCYHKHQMYPLGLRIPILTPVWAHPLSGALGPAQLGCPLNADPATYKYTAMWKQMLPFPWWRRLYKGSKSNFKRDFRNHLENRIKLLTRPHTNRHTCENRGFLIRKFAFQVSIYNHNLYKREKQLLINK